MWGDVSLHFDTDLATEFIEFNERQTKTRTGTDLNNIRMEKPRAYATQTDTCPVAVYKKYSDHRPNQFSGIIKWSMPTYFHLRKKIFFLILHAIPYVAYTCC